MRSARRARSSSERDDGVLRAQKGDAELKWRRRGRVAATADDGDPSNRTNMSTSRRLDAIPGGLPRVRWGTRTEQGMPHAARDRAPVSSPLRCGSLSGLSRPYRSSAGRTVDG